MNAFDEYDDKTDDEELDETSLMAYDGELIADENDFLLAETQVQQQKKRQQLQSALKAHHMMHVDAYVYEDGDEGDDSDNDDHGDHGDGDTEDDDVVCDVETLKIADSITSDRIDVDCHNVSDIDVIDGDGESITSMPDMDDDQLLEYHSDAAAETVNLLLPELQPTAALDCTSFVDFDEFNLCLNNLLSDDDEFPAETPIVGTEGGSGDSRGGASGGCSSTLNVDDGLQIPLADGRHHWAKLPRHASADETDLLSMVHLSDDLDLDLHEQHMAPSTTVAARTVTTAATAAVTTTDNAAGDLIDIIDEGSNGIEAIDAVIGRSSHSIVNIFQ